MPGVSGFGGERDRTRHRLGGARRLRCGGPGQLPASTLNRAHVPLGQATTTRLGCWGFQATHSGARGSCHSRSSLPDSASQSFSVWSDEPLSTRRPSGLNAHDAIVRRHPGQSRCRNRSRASRSNRPEWPYWQSVSGHIDLREPTHSTNHILLLLILLLIIIDSRKPIQMMVISELEINYPAR